MTREQFNKLKPNAEVQYEDEATGRRYRFTGPFVLFTFRGADWIHGVGLGSGLTIGGALSGCST
jgi:hypothetical protein